MSPLLDELGRLAELDEKHIRAIKSVQFEFLMARVTESISGESLHSLLRIFDRDEPTLAHDILAQLCKNYELRYLLTTNFDVNFESSFRRHAIQYSMDHALEQFESFSSASESDLRMIKLHGSVHDVQSIRAAEQRVAGNRLCTALKTVFREIFLQQEGYVAITLGYSMSDRFDIVPALSQSDTTGNAIPILQFKHCGSNATEDVDGEAAAGFLNGRRHQLEISSHTPSMLKAIARDLGIPSSDELEAAPSLAWKDHLISWWQGLSSVQQVRVRGALYLSIGCHAEYAECMQCALRDIGEARLSDEFVCSVAAIYNDQNQGESAIAILDPLIRKREVPEQREDPQRRVMIFALLQMARAKSLLGAHFEAGYWYWEAHRWLRRLPSQDVMLLSPNDLESQTKPLYGDDPDVYLWILWLRLRAFLAWAEDISLVLESVEAAAKLADLSGRLQDAYQAHIEAAVQCLECLCAFDDRRLILKASEHLASARTRYSPAFDYDGHLVKIFEAAYVVAERGLCAHRYFGQQAFVFWWQIHKRIFPWR